MTKIIVRLDLSRYSPTDLFHLYRMKLLTKEEVVGELKDRGMNEVEIIGRIRAAG